MNAAFLLVTAAWLGADAPPPPAHPVPPPAPVVAGDCNNCNNDCGCGGHHGWSSRFHSRQCGCESKTDSCGGCGGGCLDKLKGRFHRGGDCGCDSGCGHTAHHEHGCNDCGGGCGGGGFFEKCKARFHRGGDCGCDNGCGNGSNGYYGPGAAPHAEPIPAPKPGDAPKKMPDAPKSVQILTPQAPAGSTLVIEQ